MKQTVKAKLSAKVTISAYFLLLAAVLLLLLIFLYILFLSIRYDDIYRKQVKSDGDKVVELFRENMFDEIGKIHQTSGVHIFVFRIGQANSVQKVLASDGQENPFSDSGIRLSSFLDALDKSGGHATTFWTDAQDSTNVIYANSQSDEFGDIYFFVSAMAPGKSPLTVTFVEHLVLVGVLGIAAALVLAMICAKRVLAPVVNVTETARIISLGETEANFYASGYKEVEELVEYLNAGKRELKQSELIQQDFIANVSHDLRTPLTMIKAYAEMIQDISGDNPQSRNEHTKIIIEESDRLSMLVNDILQLSRMQSGRLEIKSERFNFSGLVERVVRHFRVLEEAKNYTFFTNIRKGLIVYGDPKRLEQVIYNLIANAANYTGDDKKVFIDVAIKDGQAFFQVSDTGKGIEPEYIDNIWDKYYRLDKHGQIKGSGLGLSIVKTILEEHQFYYGVNSVVNQGTSFWFYARLIKRAKRRPGVPVRRPPQVIR